MAQITALLERFSLPRVGVTDVIEIAIMAFILYHILKLLKDTRAWFILRGIAVILIFFGIAYLLHFDTIIFIAQKCLSLILMALIVAFQPEMRRALEKLGRKNTLLSFFSSSSSSVAANFDEKTVNEIVTASFKMGVARTGALIVIEREVPLNEYVHTGIAVDAVVTSQLLINIFEHNTPLHDGAVIIKGNRIESATCYLPLSQNLDISKMLGTRHRAALGVSEQTDSVTVVVSEETGQVSLAVGGKLLLNLNKEQLTARLEAIRLEAVKETEKYGIYNLLKWLPMMKGGQLRDEEK